MRAMSMTPLFSGVLSITATPFTDDGELDAAGLPRLVEFFLRCGVSGLTLLGLMGEAPALTPDERRRVIEGVVAAANGRVPIIVGCSHAVTRQAAALARQAEQLGAAAVMVMPPPATGFERDQAVRDHFRAVGEAVSLPLIIQDYPPGSGTVLTPAMLVALAQSVERFRCLKLEDTPSALKIAQVRALLGDGLPIFGGLGGLYYLDELAQGAVGTMTGFAYPDLLAAIHRAHAQGQPEQAAALFDRYLPLIVFEYQPHIGLAIRKELLRRRGALASAYARIPPARLDAVTAASLDAVLHRLALDPAATPGPFFD
jgi:4-hydroxy-tetrahydrodipicolinate synthase